MSGRAFDEVLNHDLDVDCEVRAHLTQEFERCAMRVAELIHRSAQLSDEAFARAMERIADWRQAAVEALHELEEHRRRHGC
jgi:hypothetical protein